MTRTLTITAAEWASVQDGTLWLVRAGWTAGGREAHDEGRSEQRPPAEFVQACAPCETCHGSRSSVLNNDPGEWPCLNCRIELVGPCPECDGAGSVDGDQDTDADDAETILCVLCGGTGTVTLGYGYAVGEALPIVTPRGWADSEGVVVVIWPDGRCIVMSGAAVTGEGFRLAHAGPPEPTDDGKWALKVQVDA